MVSKAILSFLLLSHTIQGFLVKRSCDRSLCPSIVLFGKNSKRGRLGSLAEDGAIITPSKTRTRKSNKSSKKPNVPAEGGEISSGLAEWVAQQDGSNPMPESTSSQGDDNEIKGKESRRVRQGVRKEQEEARNAEIREAIDSLERALEQNGNIDGILSAVRELITLESGSLKTTFAGKQRTDYRLAWVGSDNAICHVGTGLHKVPLARLQEVFMSCLGKNRLEISEVIRVLGPFPNVRNILQGSTKVGKGPVDTLNIAMDSMVDGTGKEIPAGTDDNIRRVNLQIYFCDDRAIVGVVPPEGGGVREDPLENNGANVLVFIKEADLDVRLDELRVS
eukprot:scaffold6870_cov121-Cylindrotheca_fusiformis.AAC.7